MKKHAIALGFTLIAEFAFSQTSVALRVTTGSDDLRGGNKAFVSLAFTDGLSTEEVLLTGSGIGQNSRLQKTVTFRTPTPRPLSQIRSVTIRHDGSPRPNHPFDTYDNWDLQTLQLALVDSAGNPIGNIYNSLLDPRRRTFVHRFTGESRQITLNSQRR